MVLHGPLFNFAEFSSSIPLDTLYVLTSSPFFYSHSHLSSTDIKDDFYLNECRRYGAANAK